MTATGIESLTGKRALVTGGRGFIGRALSLKLNGLGVEVFTAGRSPASEHDVGQPLVADLSDMAQVTRLLRDVKPDLIFHLASHVLGARSMEVVLSTFHGNLTSTVNLLVAARTEGCERIVLTGSLEEPDPSSTWSIPSSPYAAAKLAAGTYGRMFHALFDLPVVILRVFMVYGPGQLDRNKLVPYVIDSLLDGRPPRLTSGTRKVDWIFVDDVADAYIRAAVATGVEGETFDAGSGSLVKVGRVVDLLHELIGTDQKPVFGSVDDRPMEQIRAADLARSAVRLGWRPSTSLEDGLRATIDWHRQHPPDR